MSRTEQFYKKYNLETPEQKKEREEAELKAKKKAARKAKKEVKQRVEAEVGDFTESKSKDAELRRIQAMSDSRNAKLSESDYMEQDGVTNIETGEVKPKSEWDKTYDDHKWMTMSESFYNKMLLPQLKQQAQKEVEEEMMEQFEMMLNRVLDAREADKRKVELELAKETTEQLRLKVRLAELEIAASTTPVEFELAPMVSVINPLEGKLEEVIEEHSKAVNMITNVIQVTEDKPAKKKRKARANKAIGGDAPVIGTDYYPINKGRGGYSVAWKKVVEAGKLIDVVTDIVKWAVDKGVNVHDTTEFRKHPVCQGAYVQYTRQFSGRKGVWKEFLKELGLSK